MTKLIIKNDTTPSTPESGKTALYIDSTTKKLVSKDDAGVETSYDEAGVAASADALNSATTIVDVASSTAPTSGQVLTATSDSAATWQTPTGGTATDLASATTTVNVDSATAPSVGQVLTATSDSAATWQAVSENTTDVTFTPSDAANVPLTLTGETSQTANLLTVEDDSNTQLFAINNLGQMVVESGTNVATGSIIRSDATDQGVYYKGTAGNREEWHVSDSYSVAMTKGGVTQYTGSGYFRAASRGSVGAAMFSYRADTNTGVYSPTTDIIAFTAGGVEGLRTSITAVESALPHKMAHYATGSLPAAASFEGHIVYDSTTQTMKWSNGTVWATI